MKKKLFAVLFSLTLTVGLSPVAMGGDQGEAQPPCAKCVKQPQVADCQKCAKIQKPSHDCSKCAKVQPDGAKPCAASGCPKHKKMQQVEAKPCCKKARPE